MWWFYFLQAVQLPIVHLPTQTYYFLISKFNKYNAGFFSGNPSPQALQQRAAALVQKYLEMSWPTMDEFAQFIRCYSIVSIRDLRSVPQWHCHCLCFSREHGWLAIIIYIYILYLYHIHLYTIFIFAQNKLNSFFSHSLCAAL